MTSVTLFLALVASCEGFGSSDEFPVCKNEGSFMPDELADWSCMWPVERVAECPYWVHLFEAGSDGSNALCQGSACYMCMVGVNPASNIAVDEGSCKSSFGENAHFHTQSCSEALEDIRVEYAGLGLADFCTNNAQTAYSVAKKCCSDSKSPCEMYHSDICMDSDAFMGEELGRGTCIKFTSNPGDDCMSSDLTVTPITWEMDDVPGGCDGAECFMCVDYQATTQAQCSMAFFSDLCGSAVQDALPSGSTGMQAMDIKGLCMEDAKELYSLAATCCSDAASACDDYATLCGSPEWFSASNTVSITCSMYIEPDSSCPTGTMSVPHEEGSSVSNAFCEGRECKACYAFLTGADDVAQCVGFHADMTYTENKCGEGLFQALSLGSIETVCQQNYATMHSLFESCCSPEAKASPEENFICYDYDY